MAYATTTDMIDAFGEAEMIRLTAPEGGLDEAVVVVRAENALADASATIDGYLRARYAVPLADPPPREIARACRILARFDLAQGEQRSPSESMTKERDGVIAWLRDVAAGRVDLDVPATPPGAATAGARVSDRVPAFTAGGGIGW